MKYKIKMLCYDYGNPTPYEDEPADMRQYDTEKEAYETAFDMATDEADYLNEDCSELTSFGIVEDAGKNQVIVNCYMLESKEDTTGETEPVTIYFVEEVK